MYTKRDRTFRFPALESCAALALVFQTCGELASLLIIGLRRTVVDFPGADKPADAA